MRVLQPGSYTLVAQAVCEPIIAARPPARASVTLSIVNDSALVASMHLLEAGDPANFPVSTPLVIQCEAQGGCGCGSGVRCLPCMYPGVPGIH